VNKNVIDPKLLLDVLLGRVAICSGDLAQAFVLCDLQNFADGLVQSVGTVVNKPSSASVREGWSDLGRESVHAHSLTLRVRTMDM